MTKWLLIPCIAVALSLGGASLRTAQADHGHSGHHGHHGHGHGHGHSSHYGHGYYQPPVCQYGGYQAGYSPYVYNNPYAYRQYYVTPGVSVGRSSYYTYGSNNPGYSSSWGGYGNLGYPSTTLPRVQLRLGF